MTKILVFEDNEMLQEIIVERLRARGFDVSLAVDGQSGLEVALSNVPDLILMDMSLPILDGWEATRQLRRSKQTKEVPIIALTAHALSGDKERSLAAGCNAYQTKPIDFPKLFATITMLLDDSATG